MLAEAEVWYLVPVSGICMLTKDIELWPALIVWDQFNN